MTYAEAAKELDLVTLHEPRVTIWTTDGRELEGRRWVVDKEGAVLHGRGERIKMRVPKEQIGRIRSRDFGRFTSKLFMVAGGIAGAVGKEWRGNKSVGLKVLSTLPYTPVWAYIAAATPVHVAADGVAAFVPGKEFEIVQ